MRNLPSEKIVYFGDTARVPYGSKSKETIIRYSRQIIRFLQEQQVKAIVIACNTASAFALDAVRDEFDIPIIGVIEPGAEVAAAQTKNKRVGIIGTVGTVGSGIHAESPPPPAPPLPAPACGPAFPKKWINSVVRLYNPSLLPQQTPWGQKILKDVIEQLRYCGETLGKCAIMLREEPRLEASYLPAVYSDSMYYKATYDAARRGDWNRVKTLIDGFKPERLGTAPRDFSHSPLKDRDRWIRVN